MEFSAKVMEYFSKVVAYYSNHLDLEDARQRQ